MSETIQAWRDITVEERRAAGIPDGPLIQVHVATGQLREIQMGSAAVLRGVPLAEITENRES